MKTKEFNPTTMKSFVDNFDVIGQKYFFWLDQDKIQSLEEQNKLDKVKNDIVRFWHKNGVLDHCNSEDPIDTYRTLEKVYGKDYSNPELRFETRLPSRVAEKFLKCYVNIEGAGKLFNSKYFGFEWGMHMEYKEKKKDYSYYRDHFMHQIRNMYEMLTLLYDFNFDNTCRNIYEKNENIVSERIRNSIENEIQQLTEKDKEIFKYIAEFYIESQVKECYQTIGQSGDLDEFPDKLCRSIYYNEIICSTSVMASLFHDIGYPITYMSRISDDLQDFVPIIRDFIDVRMNITHIYAELEQSLLFDCIPHEMIEKKLMEKDHGAISAIILLKYYYNKGFIRELSPVKKMVVELAAVVIFYHTLKYQIHDEKEYDFVRPVFCDNPVSYLFRLCDDIQEWDREYFEISVKRNFFMCERCFTPHFYDNDLQQYRCCCGNSVGKNITAFRYRRLIQVNTSDKVTIKLDEEGGKKNLTIRVEYNLFRLLLMSNYSSKFAQIRAQEIRKVKKELIAQQYFPKAFVDCVVTANPITLKIKILEKYAHDRGKPVSLSSTDFCEAVLNVDKEITRKVLYLKRRIVRKCARWAIRKKRRSVFRHGCLESKQLIKNKMNFYLKLMIVGRLLADQMVSGSLVSDDDKKNKSDYVYKLIIRIFESPMFQKWDLSSVSLRYLCMDYLLQCINEKAAGDFFTNGDLESYYELYIQTDFICNEVSTYTNDRYYGQVVKMCEKGTLKNDGIPIDYYSDLYLFYEIDQCLKDDICGRKK